MTAPELILHFLTYVRVARVDFIARYLDRHWGISPGTTRNTLSRLARAGKIIRVGRGKYQRIS